MDANPIVVEVVRGPIVESRHRASIAVVDARGGVVKSWGAIDAPVFARSAVKALQALPVLETGAADRFGLSSENLALACASHSGQSAHTTRVAALLDRLGLGVEALECGCHAPMHDASAADLIRRGEAPCALHNNCSGKHAAFIATAVHRGEAVAGYVADDHPVQRRIEAAMADMTGLPLAGAPRGIDGCAIPVIALSLRGMATAMARLADPSALPAERAEACRRLTAAWAAHPLLVAGEGRFDTDFMTATGGAILTKVGAEGVHCAVLPAHGLGIALKVDDGGERASGVALGAALRWLHALPENGDKGLESLLSPVLTNRAGAMVGGVRASLE